MLTEQILPQWINAGFGMEWVTPPRMKGSTKKLYCQVTNKFGGISHIQLDSLQYEHEAEARFKNKNFSMLYVSELSYFKMRKTYDIWLECLRGDSSIWGENDFLFLGDTNPAEEGEESWIWQHWYNFRVRDDVDERSRLTQKKMALVEFTVYDNTFMSKERLDEQLARYDHSEDLRARYRDGKWVKAVGNSVFYDVFKPNIHIWGEFETPTNPDPEILVPEENCIELCTGWDIGDINHAFVIAEKVFMYSPKPDKDGKPYVVSFFKFIDEVVWIGSNYSTREFIHDCMDRILFWEQFIGRSIMWKNWSDKSAFARHDRSSGVYDHQLVFQVSQGKIALASAGQFQDSVRQRVILNKKILYEDRMALCRARCPNLIDSYQSLTAGRGMIAVKRDSKYKHAWDAASYLLCGEAFNELQFPVNEMNSGKMGLGVSHVPL